MSKIIPNEIKQEILKIWCMVNCGEGKHEGCIECDHFEMIEEKLNEYRNALVDSAPDRIKCNIEASCDARYEDGWDGHCEVVREWKRLTKEEIKNETAR